MQKLSTKESWFEKSQVKLRHSFQLTRREEKKHHTKNPNMHSLSVIKSSKGEPSTSTLPQFQKRSAVVSLIFMQSKHQALKQPF